MGELKTTPLTEVHRSLGARMVEFAGYLMPVSYRGIIEEHQAVRGSAGIFDVSHMGEFVLRGPGAARFIDELITNDCSGLPEGGVIYTVMCREDGTTVDDLLVYKLAGDRVLLVVNAANREKDFSHIAAFEREGVDLEDLSENFALIAVQGPRSREVLKACPFFKDAAGALSELPYYRSHSYRYGGADILFSRTGYTGELGFEIFVPPDLASDLWESISRAGADYGILPVGLGARDTLRFEASFCLYGHELDDSTSPLEAGLGWVVKFKKARFRGRDALSGEKRNGPRRTLVGIELEGRNIARQGYSIVKEGREIGRVTSGTFSPTLKKSLCMGLIESSAKEGGAAFEVDIRGRLAASRLVPLPFYPSRAR